MPSDQINFITGATGFVGSHVAEQLRAAGQHARALVRRGTDSRFLQALGVELAEGDLRDPQATRRAIAGAQVVYHCAARVGDWGSWREFRDQTVTAMTNLVSACRSAGVSRLLHVSSVAAYGRILGADGPEITEEQPLGQRFWWWDYYSRSKVLAEQIAREFSETTIVRPGWIYGPRDRVTMPRVVPALLEGRVPVIGDGGNYLNLIYGADVAAGAILAATRPEARGEAYNLCSRGEITQRDLLNTLTDFLSLPRIRKHVPYRLAFSLAFVQEAFARLLRRTTPPTLTRTAVYLISRPTRYSITKAREQLGWQPCMGIQEGIRRTLEWYFSLEANRHLCPNNLLAGSVAAAKESAGCGSP